MAEDKIKKTESGNPASETENQTAQDVAAKDPQQELESLQQEVAVKKKEVEKAEKAAQEELFKKYGYKILSDLKYDRKILPVGSRDHLRNLKKPEINQLIADGVISK